MGGALGGRARVLGLDRCVSVHEAPGVHTSTSTVCEGKAHPHPPQDLLLHRNSTTIGPPPPQDFHHYRTSSSSSSGPPPQDLLLFHRNSSTQGLKYSGTVPDLRSLTIPREKKYRARAHEHMHAHTNLPEPSLKLLTVPPLVSNNTNGHIYCLRSSR